MQGQEPTSWLSAPPDGSRVGAVRRRPRHQPLGDRLEEPLGDGLCDAVEQGSVDSLADEAKRRLVLCCQRQVSATRTQPGSVQAALQGREQPLVVLDPEAQRKRRDPVGCERLADIDPGAPADLGTPDLQTHLDQ